MGYFSVIVKQPGVAWVVLVALMVSGTQALSILLLHKWLSTPIVFLWSKTAAGVPGITSTFQLGGRREGEKENTCSSFTDNSCKLHIATSADVLLGGTKVT